MLQIVATLSTKKSLGTCAVLDGTGAVRFTAVSVAACVEFIDMTYQSHFVLRAGPVTLMCYSVEPMEMADSLANPA